MLTLKFIKSDFFSNIFEKSSERKAQKTFSFQDFLDHATKELVVRLESNMSARLKVHAEKSECKKTHLVMSDIEDIYKIEDRDDRVSALNDLAQKHNLKLSYSIVRSAYGDIFNL